MRNPIQPSPNRPIPLPDCILMDAWWADRTWSAHERSESALRLVIGEREEGPYDRRNTEQAFRLKGPPLSRSGPGRRLRAACWPRWSRLADLLFYPHEPGISLAICLPSGVGCVVALHPRRLRDGRTALIAARLRLCNRGVLPLVGALSIYGAVCAFGGRDAVRARGRQSARAMRTGSAASCVLRAGAGAAGGRRTAVADRGRPAEARRPAGAAGAGLDRAAGLRGRVLDPVCRRQSGAGGWLQAIRIDAVVGDRQPAAHDPVAVLCRHGLAAADAAIAALDADADAGTVAAKAREPDLR